MPIGIPVNPGRIDWTGENPGILLKEREDGPWSALALFFRIAWSPHGAGRAMMIYERPELAEGPPRAANAVITDNAPMARYLMDEFVARFGVFGEVPAFRAMPVLPLRSASRSGDPRGTRYVESVSSDALSVELVWEDLGVPTAIELPPELSGTGAHTMFSLLVEARRASILVNGRPLPGVPVPREQAGIRTTTAFLYFAETWISG